MDGTAGKFGKIRESAQDSENVCIIPLPPMIRRNGDRGSWGISRVDHAAVILVVLFSDPPRGKGREESGSHVLPGGIGFKVFTAFSCDHASF